MRNPSLFHRLAQGCGDVLLPHQLGEATRSPFAVVDLIGHLLNVLGWVLPSRWAVGEAEVFEEEDVEKDVDSVIESPISSLGIIFKAACSLDCIVAASAASIWSFPARCKTP